MSAYSRREFLATTAATLAAGSLRAAEEPKEALKVGAQSYSFRDFKLEPALKQMQSLGLKYA